jgi:hypothetical protein
MSTEIALGRVVTEPVTVVAEALRVVTQFMRVITESVSVVTVSMGPLTETKRTSVGDQFYSSRNFARCVAVCLVTVSVVVTTRA